MLSPLTYSQDTCVDERPALKLPAITVPKVAGEIERWASFKSIFENIIDDPRIIHNDAMKAQLLHHELNREARDMIEHLCKIVLSM